MCELDGDLILEKYVMHLVKEDIGVAILNMVYWLISVFI
jgi:hypothetical protein